MTMRSHLQSTSRSSSKWDRLYQEACRRADRADRDELLSFLQQARDPETALRACSIISSADLQREFDDS